jgi:glycosyltransferase involved in cell wall biosynthesis
MCRELGAHGWDIVVATTDAGMAGQLKNTLLDYRGISTIFFASQWGESFKFSRPMSDWLDANVKQFDVVHIHAVFNHSSVAAASACRKHHVPYVVRPLGSLDPWSMKQKRFRKQIFWRLLGGRLIRDAAAVHYTSQAEKELSEQTLKLNHGHVVPLGVEESSVTPKNGEELPSLFPSLNGNPYVLVLSRLHPKKALDILIDAFAEVTSDRRFQNWRLIIAGDGDSDYVKQLRQNVIDKNAEAHILFAGWLQGEDKNRVQQNASVEVQASYQENFGVSVVEALACGVPVLVSPHVNLAADIGSAGAGWVSEVDAGALKHSLRGILADNEEILRRGSAARLLSKQFTWEKAAIGLDHLYSSITTRLK